MTSKYLQNLTKALLASWLIVSECISLVAFYTVSLTSSTWHLFRQRRADFEEPQNCYFQATDFSATGLSRGKPNDHTESWVWIHAVWMQAEWKLYTHALHQSVTGNRNIFPLYFCNFMMNKIFLFEDFSGQREQQSNAEWFYKNSLQLW